MGVLRGQSARLVAAVLGAAVLAGVALAADGARGAAAVQQGGVDGLAQVINQALLDPRLAGAQADVLIRSAATGESLYARSEQNRLVPGSNEKLYTSVAAMDVLGPDYRFSTTVSADGRRDGPVQVGNLYLRGTGDPTVTPADYDALAGRVAASGVRLVTGRLVADDTFFDAPRLGNNWAWDNLPFFFQPEISALTVAADADFNVGSIRVEVRPGAAPGAPARITTVPATGFVHFVNQATTGAAGSGDTISEDRQLGVDTIVVTGSIATDVPVDANLVTVANPSGYAATLFREALARHGVSVRGEIATAATPAGASPIADRQSMPLSQLLIPFLKLSNNGHAEILAKAMGQKVRGRGSWDAGTAVILDTVAKLGVDVGAVQIVDGSGLSNLDFIPPQQTTNLLLGARQRPWFQTWYDALPIAGVPDRLVGGTLRSRMAGTKAAGNLHGKTGTLTGASALSGYVTDADGELLVFSIMENNYTSAAPKDLEDVIAVAAANFSRNAAASTRLPATARPAPARAALDPRTRGRECSWTRTGC
jgi:D-alanyl-D-alanine carboxypeptidase/D-alanyl-D-alanine-endopeptidase (penicillin-binding protein 4)